MKDKFLLVKIYDINKHFLAKGSIERITPVNMRIKGNNLPLIKSKTEIYVNVFDQIRGISIYRCIVKLAAEMQLSVDIIEKEKQLERRNSLKIRTSIHTNALITIRDSRAIENEKPVEFEILNLSIGGMLFTSKVEFMKNDIILFIFDYMKTHPFTIEAVVVRIDKAVNPYDYDNYGCKFKDLGPFEEKIVTKYLYEKQLQNHK